MPTIPPSIPPSSVLVFSLASVVPSVLSVSSSTLLPSFPLVPPPPHFLPVSVASTPAVSSFGLLASAPFFPLSSSSSASVPLSSYPPSVSSLPPVRTSLSSSSAFSPFMDFLLSLAPTLGFSTEYQSLGRWFVQSGGTAFLSCVSSSFPHLSADVCRVFSSGSSLFLSAPWSLAANPSSAVPSSFPLRPPHAVPPVSSSVLAPSFRFLPGAPVPCVPPPLSASSSFPLPSSASSLSAVPPPGFPVASVHPPPGLPSVFAAPPYAPVFRYLSSAFSPPSLRLWRFLFLPYFLLL